jgi:hypothetical protein
MVAPVRLSPVLRALFGSGSRHGINGDGDIG